MKPTRPQTHPPRRAPRGGVKPIASSAAEPTLELAAPQEHELIEGPSRDDLIRRRAYDLFQRNGCVEGRALEDWLAAEAELGREVIEGATPMSEAVERE